MRFDGFIGGAAYSGQTAVVDGENSINWYPEQVESGQGKGGTGAFLRARPGLNIFSNLPHTPVRALWGGDGRLFAVGGSKLYEVFLKDGTFAEQGDVGFDNNPASISSNGNQLMVVSAGNAYVASGTSVTLQVPAWGGTFLGSYFIVNTPNSNSFRISGIFDGGSWDDTDVATREGLPDRLITVAESHDLLWLFGRRSIEVWYNSGGSATNPFPFERVQGGIIEQGLIAAYSPNKIDDSMMWLGQDDNGGNIVQRAKGLSPERVSTHAIEEELNSYPTTADAVSHTCQFGGHNFWVLNCPSGKTTWVYDTKTGLWHRWGAWNNGQYDPFWGRCHAYVNGRHFVGDSRNGHIYEQSYKFLDDNGSPIRYLRSSPHIFEDGEFLRYNSLQIDMLVGQGLPVTLTNPDGTPRAPLVSMRYSDDGGQTWSDERTESAGLIGQTKWRVVFRQLGRSRDRVFEISISDPIRPIIVGALINDN